MSTNKMPLLPTQPPRQPPPQQPQQPEYNTDMEYLEQNMIMLSGIHQRYLEEVRKVDAVLTTIMEDVKHITTPELKPLIDKIISDHIAKKKQFLDIIKRSRKDLGFVNSIYKKVKEVEGRK